MELPHDVWRLVFELLRLRELISPMTVCQNFRSILQKEIESVEKIRALIVQYKDTPKENIRTIYQKVLVIRRSLLRRFKTLTILKIHEFPTWPTPKECRVRIESTLELPHITSEYDENHSSSDEDDSNIVKYTPYPFFVPPGKLKRMIANSEYNTKYSMRIPRRRISMLYDMMGDEQVWLEELYDSSTGKCHIVDFWPALSSYEL
jgi:hypothetical protein